jgi:hypothetical protein
MATGPGQPQHVLCTIRGHWRPPTLTSTWPAARVDTVHPDTWRHWPLLLQLACRLDTRLAACGSSRGWSNCVAACVPPSVGCGIKARHTAHADAAEPLPAASQSRAVCLCSSHAAAANRRCTHLPCEQACAGGCHGHTPFGLHLHTGLQVGCWCPAPPTYCPAHNPPLCSATYVQLSAGSCMSP